MRITMLDLHRFHFYLDQHFVVYRQYNVCNFRNTIPMSDVTEIEGPTFMITYWQRMSIFAATCLVAIAMCLPQIHILRCVMPSNHTTLCCCTSPIEITLDHKGTSSLSHTNCCCEELKGPSRMDILTLVNNDVTTDEFTVSCHRLLYLLSEQYKPNLVAAWHGRKFFELHRAHGQRPAYELNCAYLM
jgi:hypothetical protein